ncbi:hypothetical protein BD410DRAFT_892504 [Rickenella mellea]|uniref:Uncharacterized protein n=1 Tax=Rickenella mellea TaxID=50990 RepID=A0A4R5XFP9_9AGAM|nr:hypothetical protein BD410DRAFT_892504 [Rickenella mellea]
MSAYGSPYAASPALAGGAQPFAAPPGQQIVPGQITYTTTTDAQGRVTYHPFRAEPASYRTSQGVVSGIQWVPAEATQILPAGAQPAPADFTANWNRGYMERDQDRALKNWTREGEKQARREEKEAAKRVAAWEKETRERERAEEKERKRDAALRARENERDIERARERRLSNVNPIGPGGFATTPSSLTASGYERERRYSNAGAIAAERERERELDRQFADMDVADRGGNRLSGYGGPGLPRSRRTSMNLGAGGGVYDDRGPGYQGPYEPVPDRVPYAGSGSSYGSRRRDDFAGEPGGGIYPASGGYGGGGGGAYPPPSPRAAAGDFARPGGSPYRRPSPLPPGASNVYPPGHIMEGQPLGPGGTGRASPLPGSYAAGGGGGGGPYGVGGGVVAFPGGASPRMGTYAGGLPGASPRMGNTPLGTGTPEAFRRPINTALSFTRFDLMKVEDLDYFVDEIPRLPTILTTHDVNYEDWMRLMNDLRLAWVGRLPLPNVPTGRTPKRSSVITDLVDVWNNAFFIPRGVEILLYKGRDLRSGRMAGRKEMRLPRVEESDLSSTASSEESLSDPDDIGRGAYGAYGRNVQGQERWAEELREARRYRRQRKAEKRRLARQRKLERQERSKKYSLYISYIPPPRDHRDVRDSRDLRDYPL